VTAVAESDIATQPIVIDLDKFSDEQLAELFYRITERVNPDRNSDRKPTAIEALMMVMQEVQAIAKEGEFRETRKDGSQGPVKYKFRGVDAVMTAVGPSLRRHRLLPVPWVEEVRQGEYKTASGSVMRESVTFITYRIYGPRGDFVEARMAGEKSNSSDKSVAQSQSVAYRQLWLQLLCIPTDEPDPDNSNPERGSTQDHAAAREADRPSRETLLSTVATLSTELQQAMGIGEYEYLEWLVNVLKQAFGVDITSKRTADGPVEEIDWTKLDTNQLHLAWVRLRKRLNQEKAAREVGS
jgi:hypothetical protein